MILSMLRIVKNGDGSQGSYQGARDHKGPGKYILYIHFSLSSLFLGNVSWLSGHSQLRLFTRGKQPFHLKILLIIYRRAFSSKSILLGPFTST